MHAVGSLSRLIEGHVACIVIRPAGTRLLVGSSPIRSRRIGAERTRVSQRTGPAGSPAPPCSFDLVMCAIRYPGGIVPKPEGIPGCERLRERGWFDRKMVDHRVVFSLSAAGYAALEIDGLRDLEPGQQN